MKIFVNITEAASEDTIKAFKAAFFYLNKEHQYSFTKEETTDITINLTAQFFPLKSLDNYLDSYKDKELTLTEDSPLVFKGSVYVEKPQDKYFIWFPKPIDNLLDIVEINKDNASYLSNLAYVYMFGSIANINQEYLNKCEGILKLIYPNIFSNYKLVFSGIELVTAKAYGIQLIYDKLGVLAKPSNRSLINKNICFACVTSIEYTEPTYVFLHSMFAFNDIKIFKVYYVNGTKKAVKELQERYSKISPNIEVIQYSYHTKAKTKLHFNRDYVDSKMSILDELTLNYDLTVMCDCDMLCQGNLKSTLLTASISQGNIFGSRDILAIHGATLVNCFKYINGGFIIYKKGNYHFKDLYYKWKITPHKGDVGFYNEQDFINYTFYKQITYLLDINNFTAHHRSITSKASPIIYHYCGPTKPYQNVRNEHCNTVHKVIQGYITANIPETMFFTLYHNYVDTIKENLDPIFLKIIDYLKHSSELNKYNNLVLKYNLIKLGI